jgi:hypothetical protein
MHRVLKLIVPALIAVFTLGCEPSKENIEKSVREGMKTNLDVDVTSCDLTKQPDGGYVGTATATNGDVYDVTIKPPRGTRVEWRAIPPQAAIERDMRKDLEVKF